MRLSSIAAVGAACILTLTACGDDGSDSDSSDSSKSPSTSPSDGPTQRKDLSKPEKTKKPKRPDAGEATICEVLDATAVGDIVGADLERGEVQSNTCAFSDPKNPGARYVGVSQVTLEAAGGKDAVASGLQGLAMGEPEEIPDIGEQAFLVIGPTGADGTLAAAGIVQIDDAVISVGFPLAEDESAEDGRAQVTELLELVTESL